MQQDRLPNPLRTGLAGGIGGRFNRLDLGRPCDWHDLPFGELLAAPKDGGPITMWPNMDEAFLDVVTAIKKALKELGQNPKPSNLPAWMEVGAAAPRRSGYRPVQQSPHPEAVYGSGQGSLPA